MRHATTLMFAVALAVPAICQTSHLVGMGAHAEIRDALAVAAPGDIIWVQTGTYAHFTANIGVTIRALNPGFVNVQFDPAFVPASCTSFFCLAFEGPTTIDLPAQQTMRLAGLNFLGNSIQISATTVAHRVEVLGGTVIIDNCTFAASNQIALRVDDAVVHLQSTTLSTTAMFLPQPALSAVDAMISAIDSSFAGGAGLFPISGGTILLSSSTLHGSNLTITGGTTMSALTSGPSSTVWLTDSTITSGQGACAMDAPQSAGGLDRCVLTSSTMPCSQLPQISQLGVTRPQPPMAAQTFTLDYASTPNSTLWFFASFNLAPTPTGLIEQPWLTSVTSPLFVGVTVAGPTGMATASWNIPGLLPAVDLALWIHAVEGTALPLRAAPPAGGLIR